MSPMSPMSLSHVSSSNLRLGDPPPGTRSLLASALQCVLSAVLKHLSPDARPLRDFGVHGSVQTFISSAVRPYAHPCCLLPPDLPQIMVRYVTLPCDRNINRDYLLSTPINVFVLIVSERSGLLALTKSSIICASCGNWSRPVYTCS